jgi:hypothetical protein
MAALVIANINHRTRKFSFLEKENIQFKPRLCVHLILRSGIFAVDFLEVFTIVPSFRHLTFFNKEQLALLEMNICWLTLHMLLHL